MTEEQQLQALIRDAEDTVSLLSNPRKGERERSVCAAFLRCLGISFAPAEIVASETEPVDVEFRSARFQIRDIDDDGRRRHEEWRKELKRRQQAKCLGDLLRPYHAPEPMNYEELISRIASALEGKARKYGLDECKRLDALVYVNLSDRQLDFESRFPPFTELVKQHWRSVSLIFSQVGQIITANADAPDFLRENVSVPWSKWPEPFGCGLFAL